MGIIQAAIPLKQGDHILYQDVAQQYEFRSGVVEEIALDSRPAYLSLTSTDVRSIDDNPAFRLEYDSVFYKVPVEMLEGKLKVSEIEALVTAQNEVLLPPELRFMDDMYKSMIREQLELILDSYIPKGQMPKIELADVTPLLRV
ncbi:MAG: hypothetical protein WCV90_08880 [Candidatus Woesearchaeota archaeon]